jgi:hypothetical protein
VVWRILLTHAMNPLGLCGSIWGDETFEGGEFNGTTVTSLRRAYTPTIKNYPFKMLLDRLK